MTSKEIDMLSKQNVAEGKMNESKRKVVATVGEGGDKVWTGGFFLW